VMREGLPISLYVERGPLGIASIVHAEADQIITADAGRMPKQTM